MLTALFALLGCIAFAGEQLGFELRLVSEESSSTTKEYSLPERKGVSEKVHAEAAVLLESSAVQSARVSRGGDGTHSIEITFTESGAKQFAEITSQNTGKRIAILIGGQVYS
ncbi:MAG TPA: hypothetical protein VF614_07620, partial [Chthoniobacteraceae bacterium]